MSAAVKPTGMHDAVKKSELSCKLTNAELRKRKAEVIAVLKTKVLDKQELPGGYTYKFPATDEMLDELTAFIKSERACCSFFDFTLACKNDTAWLSVTGPDGAKDFITTELEF